MRNILIAIIGIAIGIGIALLFLQPAPPIVGPPSDITSNDTLGHWVPLDQANLAIQVYDTSMQKAVQCGACSMVTKGGYIGVQNIQNIINNNGNESAIQYRFFMNGQNKIGVVFYAAGAPSQVLITGSQGFCPNLCQYP